MQNSDTLQSRKKKWHFSIEKDFVCDETLSPIARMLYIILMSFASPTSPVPFPGMKLLGRLLHCTEDTVRKYRKELEECHWIEVEHRRDGHNKFTKNAYVLLDGPEPGAVPKKPGMENFRVGEIATRKNTGIKSLPEGEEKTTPKARPTSSSNTAPSASGAAAAAEDLPSASVGADAPKPPSPTSKAATFIQNFVKWGQQAGLSVSVVPREKDAVIEFFESNQHFTVRELTAIQINAWCMPSMQSQRTDLQLFWHCNLKSKRIKTFLEFLPAITDELDWQGSAKRIDAAYRKAEAAFLQKAAA